MMNRAKEMIAWTSKSVDIWMRIIDLVIEFGYSKDMREPGPHLGGCNLSGIYRIMRSR